MNFQQPNKWQEAATLVAQYVVNLHEKVVSKALIPFPCPSSCTNFCPVCIFFPGNAKAQCLCTCCLPEMAVVLTEASVCKWFSLRAWSKATARAIILTVGFRRSGWTWCAPTLLSAKLFLKSISVSHILTQKVIGKHQL